MSPVILEQFSTTRVWTYTQSQEGAAWWSLKKAGSSFWPQNGCCVKQQGVFHAVSHQHCWTPWRRFTNWDTSREVCAGQWLSSVLCPSTSWATAFCSSRFPGLVAACPSYGLEKSALPQLCLCMFGPIYSLRLYGLYQHVCCHFFILCLHTGPSSLYGMWWHREALVYRRRATHWASQRSQVFSGQDGCTKQDRTHVCHTMQRSPR